VHPVYDPTPMLTGPGLPWMDISMGHAVEVSMDIWYPYLVGNITNSI